MSQGSARADASRALLQGGLLFLLSFLVLTVVVTQQRFVGADLAARAMIHQSHHPVLLGFMEGVSFMGGQPGQVAMVVAGFVTLWPRRRRWALALPVVAAGAGVVQFLVKWAVDRPRPNLGPWGFPSAHVLSLVVLCGYLAYAVSIGRTRQRRRRLVAGACVAIVATVAYSRMYLDAHFLSDVLGGVTAGLAYLFFAIWAVRSAPSLGRARRAVPLATGTEGLLVPAPAGSPADPLAATAAVSAMIPVTPTVDAR
jgi:undecaprenyl-diphosphatase